MSVEDEVAALRSRLGKLEGESAATMKAVETVQIGVVGLVRALAATTKVLERLTGAGK